MRNFAISMSIETSAVYCECSNTSNTSAVRVSINILLCIQLRQTFRRTQYIGTNRQDYTVSQHRQQSVVLSG